ncbi:MAG: DM13 domain-containing protein [Cyanobacteria bacterium P01_D01_bin.44]
MKLTYFAALAISSMLTVGTAVVAPNVQPAYANPCAAVNPCAAADPCAAANPCAAADPCAAAGAETGSFVTASSDTAGGVSIVEENGKRYLEFDETFSTEEGPDLFVLLHKEATPQSYSSDQFVNLGDLQSISGSQRYEIPEDVSIDDFKSAVIWCREFNVTFGFAAI